MSEKNDVDSSDRNTSLKADPLTDATNSITARNDYDGVLITALLKCRKESIERTRYPTTIDIDSHVDNKQMSAFLTPLDDAISVTITDPKKTKDSGPTVSPKSLFREDTFTNLVALSEASSSGFVNSIYATNTVIKNGTHYATTSETTRKNFNSATEANNTSGGVYAFASPSNAASSTRSLSSISNQTVPPEPSFDGMHSAMPSKITEKPYSPLLVDEKSTVISTAGIAARYVLTSSAAATEHHDTTTIPLNISLSKDSSPRYDKMTNDIQTSAGTMSSVYRNPTISIDLEGTNLESSGATTTDVLAIKNQTVKPNETYKSTSQGVNNTVLSVTMISTSGFGTHETLPQSSTTLRPNGLSALDFTQIYAMPSAKSTAKYSPTVAETNPTLSPSVSPLTSTSADIDEASSAIGATKRTSNVISTSNPPGHNRDTAAATEKVLDKSPALSTWSDWTFAFASETVNVDAKTIDGSKETNNSTLDLTNDVTTVPPFADKHFSTPFPVATITTSTFANVTEVAEVGTQFSPSENLPTGAYNVSSMYTTPNIGIVKNLASTTNDVVDVHSNYDASLSTQTLHFADELPRETTVVQVSTSIETLDETSRVLPLPTSISPAPTGRNISIKNKITSAQPVNSSLMYASLITDLNAAYFTSSPLSSDINPTSVPSVAHLSIQNFTDELVTSGDVNTHLAKTDHTKTLTTEAGKRITTPGTPTMMQTAGTRQEFSTSFNKTFASSEMSNAINNYNNSTSSQVTMSSVLLTIVNSPGSTDGRVTTNPTFSSELPIDTTHAIISKPIPSTVLNETDISTGKEVVSTFEMFYSTATQAESMDSVTESVRSSAPTNKVTTTFKATQNTEASNLATELTTLSTATISMETKVQTRDTTVLELSLPYTSPIGVLTTDEFTTPSGDSVNRPETQKTGYNNATLPSTINGITAPLEQFSTTEATPQEETSKAGDFDLDPTRSLTTVPYSRFNSDITMMPSTAELSTKNFTGRLTTIVNAKTQLARTDKIEALTTQEGEAITAPEATEPEINNGTSSGARTFASTVSSAIATHHNNTPKNHITTDQVFSTGNSSATTTARLSTINGFSTEPSLENMTDATREIIPTQVPSTAFKTWEASTRKEVTASELFSITATQGVSITSLETTEVEHQTTLENEFTGVSRRTQITEAASNQNSTPVIVEVSTVSKVETPDPALHLTTHNRTLFTTDVFTPVHGDNTDKPGPTATDHNNTNLSSTVGPFMPFMTTNNATKINVFQSSTLVGGTNEATPVKTVNPTTKSLDEFEIRTTSTLVPSTAKLSTVHFPEKTSTNQGNEGMVTDVNKEVTTQDGDQTTSQETPKIPAAESRKSTSSGADTFSSTVISATATYSNSTVSTASSVTADIRATSSQLDASSHFHATTLPSETKSSTITNSREYASTMSPSVTERIHVTGETVGSRRSTKQTFLPYTTYTTTPSAPSYPTGVALAFGITFLVVVMVISLLSVTVYCSKKREREYVLRRQERIAGMSSSRNRIEMQVFPSVTSSDYNKITIFGSRTCDGIIFGPKLKFHSAKDSTPTARRKIRKFLTSISGTSSAVSREGTDHSRFRVREEVV
ncbi:unnamed protein product [Clavelina lepadiformis]|uniref:Uncharacterized protein n=1 Tax=Clavelina lepadiformis TaxID=159417 RepID=A0ABP0GBL5_CLALP